MNNYDLNEDTIIILNDKTDQFVGLKIKNNKISISFPICYVIPDNQEQLKKDIKNLIYILYNFNKNEGINSFNYNLNFDNEKDFPILSYMYVLKNYISNNYQFYKEKINSLKVDNKGKILWSQTIKNIKPIVSNNNLIYTKFITKYNINDDKLITEIHKLCVEESYKKIGFLFNKFKPVKSNLNPSLKLCNNILIKKISNTNKDEEKLLFNHMLKIINFYSSNHFKNKIYFGTYKFENLWEKLIHNIFSNTDKRKYFPQTFFQKVNSVENKFLSNLEPDSIMEIDNTFFVIDSKYYKYGLTKNIYDLPKSRDINKQITYGEYVYNKTEKDVYNIFILPYKSTNDNIMEYFGKFTSNWDERKDIKHNKIIGIFLDINYLIRNFNETKDIKFLLKDIILKIKL